VNNYMRPISYYK